VVKEAASGKVFKGGKEGSKKMDTVGRKIKRHVSTQESD
jgi:hypothetical protein